MKPDDLRTFQDAASKASDVTGFTVQFEDHYRYNEDLVAARFRLGNGLKIVFMPDFRAKIFAYHTWFRVGSRDEDPRRTGLAHLFEHLMFKGTTHHPRGEFDREMELRGSQTNAATWVDWTFYMETLAVRPGNLEAIIGFESDRMVNLVLDEETFRSELDVVKNERRMSVEDSVGGSMSEALFATAYKEHGYRWPTIGYMEHLNASTLEEITDFYRTFYAPNNATVIVVGALDAADTLAAIARGYGPIERQPIPSRRKVVEPPQQKDQLVTLRKPVSAPQLLIGYHAPPQGSVDFAALEMLGDALVSGESCRLYQRLVIEKKMALDAYGFLPPFSEPGLYEFGVQARPGVEPEAILKVVEDELSRLEDGLTEAELTKARNNLELALFIEFRNAQGCAESLGHYETNFGDYSLALKSMEQWERVTEADLKRVAQEVFRPSNRTTVIALPAD